MSGARLARTLAAVLCALPWLRSGLRLPAWLSASIDFTFAPLCHHLRERVLSIGGVPMCVCSRCAGLYAGLALGFLLPKLRGRGETYSRLLAFALVANVIDVVTQDLGLHAPLHPLRLLLGALMGAVISAWMVSATAPSTPSSASSSPLNYRRERISERDGLGR